MLLLFEHWDTAAIQLGSIPISLLFSWWWSTWGVCSGLFKCSLAYHFNYSQTLVQILYCDHSNDQTGSNHTDDPEFGWLSTPWEAEGGNHLGTTWLSRWKTRELQFKTSQNGCQPALCRQDAGVVKTENSSAWDEADDSYLVEEWYNACSVSLLSGN